MDAIPDNPRQPQNIQPERSGICYQERSQEQNDQEKGGHINLLELKEQLVKERGWCCEICGKPQTVLHAHHCLFHRMKGKPQLDTNYNIQLVCEDCHSSVANSYENRQEFYERQALRYGKEFYAWYESLSLKVKKF